MALVGYSDCYKTNHLGLTAFISGNFGSKSVGQALSRLGIWPNVTFEVEFFGKLGEEILNARIGAYVVLGEFYPTTWGGFCLKSHHIILFLRGFRNKVWCFLCQKNVASHEFPMYQ